MFDRLKRILVQSFIGPIALGYLLAQAILYLVNIFPTLAAGWVLSQTAASARPQLQAAFRQAVAFVVLLLIWYGLLRWLYFTPINEQKPRLASNPETSHTCR
jgi:uncharacterized RDD family membrane protein YckC